MSEAYQLFEKHLIEVISKLREEIALRTDRTDVLFNIRASGRVNEGEFKITFALENKYDSKCDVRGGRLEPVLMEYVRRNSWQKTNEPLCLPNVKADEDEIPPVPKAPVDDEIPF